MKYLSVNQKNCKMKNILITIFYADGLHGGVKYTVELSEYFQLQGYNVYVAGILTNYRTRNYFKKHDINFFEIQDLPLDIEYDIVWAHHFPIVPYLIQRGLKYKRLINSCISKILPIERYFWFYKNVDMLLCLTQETKNMLVNEYNIPESRIRILPNTAPDIFFEQNYTVKSDIKSIAVISNHPPKEVIEALKLFKKQGYKTIIYGGKHQKDITPDILKNHDVVITIGKTVQYCLAMGIPVYNYDHFGGSGYITLKNIDIEENSTFSGRSFFTKKTAEQIKQEIISQYKKTIKEQTKLKQIAKKRYKLSTRISEIINIIETTKPVQHVKITNSNRLFFDYCQAFIDIVNSIKPKPKTLSGWARIVYCLIPLRNQRHKFKQWYLNRY